MANAPPFILVDGSSYLFRAFHALPPLTNSQGEPTGATVGVINMLRKLIADYQPTHIAVVFDAPGKTFRDALYPEYKAHRPPMPEELRVQIEPTLDIIRAMGLPLLIVDGVEADDVIGTLAQQATEQGVDTLVSTGDKDMAQLVNAHVTLINTMTDTVTDESGVMAKFGVRPDQIIDFLALTGDTVDNIPGVPKCGPKTAAKWLGEFDTLDNLMAHADRVKGKIGESLRASLDFLPLSRALTTIKTDVALDLGPADLAPQAADQAVLRRQYERLESRRLLASLDAAAEQDDAGPSSPEPTADYTTVLDQAVLDEWLRRLGEAELISFDTETTSLDYMQAR
ncbi:MAG: DNA polymerase I, partial [Gammaproteobacteria bacterium]|nr:DNA polymerase I [Gammaproteobacteria bacterium]